MSTTPQSVKEGTIQLPTLSPYIQRLLRLIKEGTREHGIVSAQLLGKVTSPSATSTDADDCILLWDILGRLQSFLYNCSTWINRESASLAMYYVAQNIPQNEQIDFLNQIECKEDSESESNWLELSDIIKNLDDILKHGQLFLSGEVIIEGDENSNECKCSEDVHKLENLDIYEEKNFLVKMELQRKIISKRLGLSFLLNKEDILDNILSKEDSVGATIKSKETAEIKSTKKRKREDKGRIVYKVEEEENKDEKKDESNRLIYILQLQNSLNGKEGKGEQKHINAQRLLAMDLMYHTTHSLWKIRHGAFLGLLSLLRAWKQKQQQESCNKRIGKWQMDILSRSTCILCLDQFVDFSVLEDVKAPVREICAQYISYCCSVYKDVQNDILVFLLKLLLCHKDEWQIQFGALLVVKYLCAKDASLLLNPVKLFEAESDTTLLSTLQMMCNNQSGRQQNVIPEILNLMTQILLIPFDTNYPQNYSHEQEKSVKDEILMVSCVWLHNSIQHLVSFSSQDEEENMSFTYTYIVQLFTKLIQWNSNDVFSTIQKPKRKQNNYNWIESIFRCYLHLLSNNTSKEIHISSLICFQFFIPYIGNELHQIENEEDWLEHKMVVMYSDALMTLFDMFFQDLEKDVLNVLFDTWNSVKLTTYFSSAPKLQLLWKKLYFSLLLKFFNIPDHYSAMTTKVTKYVTNNDFQESSIECRIQACNALIQICQTVDDAILKVQNKFLDFIPFFITSFFMHSPYYYHVESSLLLYYQFIISIPQTKNNDFLINLCKSVLYDEKILFYNDNDVNVEELQLYCKSYHKIIKDILFSSSNYDQLNQDMIIKKIINLSKRDKLLPAKQTLITATIKSMRIRAILAGILISFYSKSSENNIALLSMKLTPIIRATVTSIKNECDLSRQSLTINDMIQLLIILKGNTNIRDKIVYNIVNMSLRQQSESNMNVTAYQTSRCLLKDLFQNNDFRSEPLRTQPPIYSLLDPLSRINDECTSILLNEELHYRGLQLLEIISESDSSVSIFKQIFQETMIMNGVTNMVCHIHSSKKIKSLATITIINFCTSKEPSRQSIVFDSILACIFKKIQNRDKDHLRCNACYLLHSIVASLNVKSLSRVVKCLLPVSMYLMNDEIRECAKSACSMFATLVRVAPLATNDKTDQCCLPQFLPPGTVKNTSSQVMDHLLRGLPLPSCTLPHAIQQHLQQNHIVLRPYQKEGIAWINFLQTVHLHGILCDDMGLGKTLQALIGIAIAHCNHKSNDHKSLIICPTTLIGHWCLEIQRFFPNLPSNKIFHVTAYTNVGSSKERKALLQQNSKYNLVITSYSMIRKDIDIFKREKWLYCCLDEGHLLKNPKTATSRAVKQIQSKYKLILSGTILQNHVQELWAVFDYLMPNFLGNAKQFHTVFAKPIDKGHQSHATPEEVNTSIHRLKSLHQQVLPFILRREKNQVLPELPPKIITDVPCVLSKEQEELYSSFCSNLAESSSTLPSSLAEITKAMEEVGEDGSCLITNSSGKHNVLTSFLYLRLLCSHPILVAKKSNDADGLECEEIYTNLNCSGKLMALNDLLRNSGIYDKDLVAADNDMTALYVNDNVTMNNEDEELDGYYFNEKANYSFFENVPSSNDCLPSTVTESKKCILFAQFIKTLDVIEKYLFQPHMPSLRYLRLDGKTVKSAQHRIIEEFQTDDTVQILLLTTKIGGLGLNLNMADMVIVFEQDWNPQVDLQAMDRAHRIGQKKAVNVYRFITKNTIEEKIRRLQTKKIAVTSAIINTENSCLYSMGTERLLDIFSFNNNDNFVHGNKEGLNEKPQLPLNSDGHRMDHDNDDAMYREEYSNLSLDTFLEWFR